jgi:PIN domain nuclease of toxin-antitoxin system
MTAILIDTHFYIWIRQSPSLIRPTEQKQLDEADRLYVSIAALWEIGTLLNKKRLPATTDIFSLPEAIQLLPVTLDHCTLYSSLPNMHGDPFDRMMIAQAKCERLIFMSRDQDVQKYL